MTGQRLDCVAVLDGVVVATDNGTFGGCLLSFTVANNVFNNGSLGFAWVNDGTQGPTSDTKSPAKWSHRD